MTTQSRAFLIADLDGEIREQVYDHVFASDGAEVGGVFVGDIDATGKAEVHGMIPALEADAARASVTFTHEAWQSILERQERDFPDSPVIVGWYHSHPGFGIFLSEHDLFIHRNFFREPFQLAYVVDPQDEIEGIFGWRDGEIVLFEEGRTPRRRGKRRPTVVVDLDDIADDAAPAAPTAYAPLAVVPATQPVATVAQDEVRARRSRRRMPLVGLALLVAALAAVGLGLSLSGSNGSAVRSARTVDQSRTVTASPQKGPTFREIAGNRALIRDQVRQEAAAQRAYELAQHPPKPTVEVVPHQLPHAPATPSTGLTIPRSPQTPTVAPKGRAPQPSTGGKPSTPNLVHQ
jgi:proteasome lid subunit RPN8/RPN11